MWGRLPMCVAESETDKERERLRQRVHYGDVFMSVLVFGVWEKPPRSSAKRRQQQQTRPAGHQTHTVTTALSASHREETRLPLPSNRLGWINQDKDAWNLLSANFSSLGFMFQKGRMLY